MEWRYLTSLSLRVKYAAVSGVIILVLVVGLTWVFVKQTNQWLVQNLQLKGLSKVEGLAMGAASAVRDGDREGLGQLIQEVFAEAEVTYVGVLDSGGQVLDQRLRRQRMPELPSEVVGKAKAHAGPISMVVANSYGGKSFFFVTPVIDRDGSGEIILGAVVLGISSYFLQRDIREIVRATLPISVGGLVASCLLVLFLIEKNLRPLTAMAHLTSRIAQGDFSQRLKVERRDEIGQLGTSFNAMAESLMEKDSMRTAAEEALAQKAAELERSHSELQQFLYVASHDLQEPFRMVASFTQLLAKRYRGKLDSDADEFIAYAVDGVVQMQWLIRALLDYLQVEMRGKELAPTDCGDVLESTLVNLRAAIEESGAVVTRDSLPTVMADGTQLGQLFQNLIGNGIKFRNEAAPRIHVSSKQNGKEWLFSVSDKGIGIDPKYAERVFVIFQRLHGREKYPGTGIGLAVCKKIVERHGGRIWVESEEGKGATFYFTIPATF